MEDGEIGKFYGVDAFIVSGHVTGVAHGRRGVPYYGGPRYSITWENGEVDEEITATDLLNHYKETPQSLGCSNTLDEWLSDQLYDIASTAGCILEAQRVKTFLIELRHRIQRNNMKANTISEIGLESIATMISGTREISLVGYNTKKAEMNTLADFFPVKQASSSSTGKAAGKVEEEEVYQQTVFTVGQLMLGRSITSELLITTDKHNTDWISLEMEVCEGFVWSNRANYDRFFVVLHRSKFLNNKTSELDLMVVESVVLELSKAIKTLWLKEVRKRARKEVLKELEHKMFDWKTATVNELCYNVLQHISPHLPGADLYVGLVDPGGSQLTYVSSTVKSKMEGKVLKRGEGVSFDVLSDLNTIVLRPEDLDKGKLLVEGCIVDVYYGRKLHRCKIEKVRGHEKFDVRYDCDRKVEAGVDASRIVPHSFAFRMKKFGKAVYPFVCVALKNRSKAVGVLGIDSFTQVAKADYESHPDADLIAFLEKVGSILGSNIDIQRKKISMQVLYSLAKNQFAEVTDVMAATFEVLFNNLTNVTGLIAARHIYEETEPKYTHGLKILHQKGVIGPEILHRMEQFNPAKSSLKVIQKFGEKISWMLCRLRPAVRNEQGRIFIIAVTASTPISDPDLEFLGAVQKVVAGILQNIVSFKAVTEMRYESLREVKALCDTSERYSRQKLFNLVVDSVQSCFYSANMYVGVLSPYNKSIDYILASIQSDMAGKSLARADKTGVSFQIVDELKPIGVSGSSPLAFKLFHFGPRQQFEFPYIGIPLIVHVDAMIGVLGVDHCEDPSAVSDQLSDSISFFTAVGTYLGQVVRKFREDDARARLKQIAREARSYSEGIRDIKKVILEVLPFAKRILEMAFEPTAAEITVRDPTDDSGARIPMTHTMESYTVVLQVPAAFCFSAAVKNAQLRCIWQGNMIFSCKISPDGETKAHPVLINIPSSVSLDIVKIQFTLFGTIATNEREIAHKEVDLVYLLNAPLYLMEHYLESTLTKSARVARFHLLTKVFQEIQVVGFIINEIQVKGIANLFETYHSHKSSHRQTAKEIRQQSLRKQNSSARSFVPKIGDVFSVLKWNDELVTKTPALTSSGELSWNGLNCYLKMESHELPKNLLQLEIWDERKNGEFGTAYGRLDLAGEALRDYLDGATPWLELGALFPEGVDGAASAASVLKSNAVVKLKGRVVTAARMNQEQMLQEFNASLKTKTKKSEGSQEKEKQFHMCELGVLAARELGRNEAWPAAAKANVFAVVYFNGEEIGRTPISRNYSVHPSWEDENFKVRVPDDEELEMCTLTVELSHLDELTNIEEAMGRVDISGKALANFLTSNKMKCAWFDVEAAPLSIRSAIVAQGELKLTGRPLSVEATDEQAKELGYMELHMLAFANMRSAESKAALSANAPPRTFAIVYFNGRQIYRSKSADGSVEGTWEKEKITFRYPNNKPLFQCVLKLEVWHMIPTSAAKAKETLLGSTELTGSALSKLMAQKGLITKWLPVALIANSVPGAGEESEKSAFAAEIQVKGGPQGGKDIFEDCDEHLLLDILAATRLPPRKSTNAAVHPDSRPTTFCEVTWNQKRIGRTAVVPESAHPIWDRQRFNMRIPLITTKPDVSIVSQCKLRLDIFDLYPDETEAPLGTLTLVGADLEALFEQSAPQVLWFPLRTTKGSNGKLLENEPTEDDDAGELKSELKLRGTKTGVSDEPKRLPDEYILQIVSARDLSNTDIFGGADSFVVVEWLGDIVGQTQVVPKSVNPMYHAETFILKNKGSVASSMPTLCMSVYSKQAAGSVPIFLGRVLLEKTELGKLFSTDSSGLKEMSLGNSTELTDEENQLVKGKLAFQLSRFKTFPQDIITKRDAILWIVSADHLPKTSAFGVSSDVFCKVFRRSDRDGGEDVEITQTDVAKSSNPKFKEVYIPIEVPAYDDWAGFQIRVEIWDVTNEPVGGLVLRNTDALSLLGRSGSQVLMPVTYELLDGGTISSSMSPPPSAIGGVRNAKLAAAKILRPDSTSEAPSITLIGGLRGDFEAAMPNRPRTSSAVQFDDAALVPLAPSDGGRLRTYSESEKDTPSRRLLRDSSSGKSMRGMPGDDAVVSVVGVELLAEATKVFCIVRWKGAQVGRTSVADPKMGAEDALPWADEQFPIKLDPENSLTNSTLEVDVIVANKRDGTIGTVSLTTSDLVKLFDPADGQLTLPIIDAKSGRTIMGRKKTAGNLTLKGSIPRLQEEYDELHSELVQMAEEIEADPELQPAEFELSLLKAYNLAQVNKIGKAVEAFASVYWEGKDEALGKTEVISGSVNPVFDCEYFVLKKPSGVKYADCKLRVALYSKNFLAANTFLGEVLLTGEDLKSWFVAETEKVFALCTSTVERGSQAYVQGEVCMAMKKIPDIVESPLFNNSLPLPSHLIEVEVSVLSASGLAKVNTLGLSNPYCKLQWGRASLGQTAVVSDSLNPMWEDNETFTLRVPNSWDYRKKKRAKHALAAATAGISAPTDSDLVLTVSLYNWSRIGEESFMGSAEIRGEELVRFISGGQYSRRWFNLRPTKRLKQRDQRFAQGRVQVLVTHKARAGEGDFKGKDVEFMVCAARDLVRRKDNAHAEIFVRSRWNGRIVGKTFHSEEPVAPVWEDERFHARLPGTITLDDCLLELEVWQFQKSNSKSHLAGIVTLKEEELRNLVEGSNFSSTWFPISPSPFMSAALVSPNNRTPRKDASFSHFSFNEDQADASVSNDHGLGQLQIRCGFAGKFLNVTDAMIPYDFSVLAATGLCKADVLLGSSDPYVICKWNGREIGRTPHVSRSVTPTWSGQKFLLMLDLNEDVGQNLLQVEVWNHRVISKGEFLGCLHYTGPRLQQLVTTLLKENRCWCDLERSPVLDSNRQKLVKGKIEIGLQVRRKENSSGDTLKDAVSMQWNDICVDDAGPPMLKFQLCSVQKLPVAEVDPTSKGFLLGARTVATSSALSFTLAWNGEEVGRSAPLELEAGNKQSASWADEVFYLRVPADSDECGEKTMLLLTLWDVTTPAKPLFLGKLELSFASLWTLYGGEFTFPLQEQVADALLVPAKGKEKDAENRLCCIRGTVTFQLEMVFPFWDSVRSIVPRTYHRRLSICGATNLPLINDEPPNSKCVVMFDGAIKGKTIVVLGNVAPNWPRVDIDLIVDKAAPIEVLILLYHISPLDKKEVIIGQEVIPFDYLLRPPSGIFELFLGPSNKRVTGFKFTPSGSVRLQIVGSNTLSESSLPYSHRMERPIAALVAKDLRGYNREKITKLDHELNGDVLSPDERLWLGTACDLVSPQLLVCRPAWVILPVQDIGMKIGPMRNDLIGTNPGFRFSLCIEREGEKVNVSDPLMLQDLSAAISECITKLRKKDIYRIVREKALRSLRAHITEMTTIKAVFDKEAVMKLIHDAVSLSFPGVVIRTATVSQDFKAINYSHFPEFPSQAPHLTSTLYEHQGSDWELIGRTLNRSALVSKYADLFGKIVSVFHPFPLSRFPRISVPLRSGDAALGFFQVENFDVQMGGIATGGLTEESELKTWFEDIGDVCGGAIYAGNEARVLTNIDAFCACWNSSINGLIADLASDSFSVVQGCRLMEILSIDEEYNITSLLQRKPNITSVGGNIVVLQSITFKVHVQDTAASSSGGTRRFSTLGGAGAALGDMFSRRRSVMAPNQQQQEVTGEQESPKPPILQQGNTVSTVHSRQLTSNSEDPNSILGMATDAFATSAKRMVAGVRYDGVEQLHAAVYDTVTKLYTIPATHVSLKTDRVVLLSLYEVDDNLNVLAEFVGKFNFATFQETEFKTGLSTPSPMGASAANPVQYDADIVVNWPTKYEFSGENKHRANVSGFKLSIKRARELQTGGSSSGSSDPFCEVLYGTKMIKQTEVKKKTLAPVWDEEIMISNDHKHSLVVDVYDMNFMRKGEFLGRVEIPHDHLLNSTGQEVDYTLKPKAGVNMKKQTKVGGVLTLQCSAIEAAVVRKRDEEVSRKEKSSVEIPKEVWNMLCPSIQLTIKSATELARANNFGGASDPFVLIFVGSDTDPIDKTQFIENNLNPKWNSEFNLILGVNMEKGVTAHANFPSVRLEVYNYNKMKAADFLGACEITPAMYFSQSEVDLPLRSLPKKKADLVKGRLQAEFSIVDKVVKPKEQVYSFTALRSLQSIVCVEVHIMKARNLMQANKTGNSDPYVVLKWNGQIQGQTSVKINTLNPTWSGEKFVVNIHTQGNSAIGEMTMEVWDKDFFKEGDFMGEAKVTGDVFMHPPPVPIDLELKPKPEVDPHQAVAKLTKIQGTISVRFVARVVQQRPDCDQQRAKMFHMEKPQLDPVKLLMAYDPEQEVKRQKKEKMTFAGVLEKVSAQMDKYLNHPFERTGLISELHYGQLAAASRRAEQTTLKTATADMLCMPTYQKGARPDQCFYLMARYDAGQIPRRDVQFMGKLHEGLSRGLKHINDREARSKSLAELEKSMELLSTATDNPSGIIVQAILDLEVTLNCQATLYLLGPDGTSLVKCSVDIGEVDPETPPADEFTLRTAQVCRHGFMIQKYRGEYGVINLDWDNFTQLTIPPLTTMVQAFDEIEEPNIIKSIIAAGELGAPTGAMFAPLLANGEVFMGLLALSKVDGVPSAMYRVEPPVEVTATAEGASVVIHKPYTEVEKMEHGFANSVKVCSALFGNAIYSSRLGTIYRKIKSFPIKHDTDPLMVIRYAFRLLVTAVPAIRNISVWAVDINREPVLVFAKQEMAAPKEGMFSRLISSARISLRLSGDPSVRSSSLMAGLSSKKGPPTAPAESTGAATTPATPVVKLTPSIMSGCFGSENPTLLLAAPIERAVFGSQSEHRTPSRYSQIDGHHKIINDQRDRFNEKMARWKIDLPEVVRKSAEKMGQTMTITEEDEEDESFGEDSSLSGSRDSGRKNKAAEMGEVEEDAMNFIHAEIARYSISCQLQRFMLFQLINCKLFIVLTAYCRCVKVLQSKTFRVLTGHTLSAIGMSAQSEDILSAIFPQLPEDPLQPTPPPTGPVNSQRTGPPPRAPLPPEPQSSAQQQQQPQPQQQQKGKSTARVPPNRAPATGQAGEKNTRGGGKPPSGAPPKQVGEASTDRKATIDAAAKAPLVQRRARPPPSIIAQEQARKRRTTKQLNYFIAVNTNGKQHRVLCLIFAIILHFLIIVVFVGIGGSSGWGVMGESLEKTVATIAELVEANLMKLADQRAKMESGSSRISPKGGTASPMSSSRSGLGAFAFPSSDDEVGMKPSMMIALGEENDAGGDSADSRYLDASMEEID